MKYCFNANYYSESLLLLVSPYISLSKLLHVSHRVGSIIELAAYIWQGQIENYHNNHDNKHKVYKQLLTYDWCTNVSSCQVSVHVLLYMC